jgi:peptidoglycan hydrolase-like protein with peptidoglycan-binding domain
VVAALAALEEPARQQPAKPQAETKLSGLPPGPRVEEPPKPAVNTHELVLAAQQELARIGCFDGAEDGKLGPVTTRAIARYLSRRGRKAADIDVTGDLVKDLTRETSRVCPLVCAAGQVAKDERCVAVERTKPTKPAVARQRDESRDTYEDRRRSRKARRDDRRRGEASRPKPRTRQEAVRRQPSQGGGSAMIGVGF